MSTLNSITNRHSKTPNEIIIEGRTARLQLYSGRSNLILVAEAIIDSEDALKVSKYKWGLVQGYAKNWRFPLASFIMGLPRIGFMVDHKNGDRLDNRKSNLRVVTRWENNINRTSIRKPTSSKYKGVYTTKKTINLHKPWRAVLKHNKVLYFIGYYSTEEEAAWMYDQYAMEIFGEFARLNFDYSSSSEDLLPS